MLDFVVIHNLRECMHYPRIVQKRDDNNNDNDSKKTATKTKLKKHQK